LVGGCGAVGVDQFGECVEDVDEGFEEEPRVEGGGTLSPEGLPAAAAAGPFGDAGYDFAVLFFSFLPLGGNVGYHEVVRVVPVALEHLSFPGA
jgi:hypothetical protein